MAHGGVEAGGGVLADWISLGVLASAVPRERKMPEREAPALGRWKPEIDRILEEDKTAPRKQRHTAKRIHQRQQRTKRKPKELAKLVHSTREYHLHRTV